MGGINFSIHPLFFLFGVYYALTGRIFVFVIYTICAVVHELGHSYVAQSIGYRLKKITLMPFGAVVSGNIDGLNPVDEIKIALAGPLINLLIGFVVVGTWWLFPVTYAYTDIVAEANFTMALINFLPVYPLDGGRILSAVLKNHISLKNAERICKGTGLVFSLVLLSLFIVSIFNKINLSILFFSLFVIAGTFSKEKENRYIKIFRGLDTEGLKRGMSVKRTGVDKDISIKNLIKLLDNTAINEIEVYDGKEKIALLTESQLEKIILNGNIYGKLSSFM